MTDLERRAREATKRLAQVLEAMRPAIEGRARTAAAVTIRPAKVPPSAAPWRLD